MSGGALAFGAVAQLFGEIFQGVQARKQQQAQRRWYEQNWGRYLGEFYRSEHERRQAASGFLGLLSGSLQNIPSTEVPEELLVSPERVKGVPTNYLQDLATATVSAQAAGAKEEVARQLAQYDQLPGGTQLALTQQTQEKALGQRAAAQAQVAAEGRKAQIEVDRANAENALNAATTNLQTTMQSKQAAAAAYTSLFGSAFGPLAQLLMPRIAQQLGAQAPEMVIPGNLGAGINDSMQLYYLMNQGKK